MRFSLLRASLLCGVATLSFGGAASAADVNGVYIEPPPAVQDEACRFAGSFGGGGGFINTHLDADLDDDDDDDFEDVDWSTYNVDVAALGTCGAWNLQGDASYTNFNPNTPFAKSNDAWHIGGAAFWRDPSHGLIGLDAAIISDEVTSKSNDGYRVGVRAEFFASDHLTVGGRVGYFDRDVSFFEPVSFKLVEQAIEASAFVKAYVHDDFALTATGDLLWSDFRGGGPDAEVQGYGVTLRAEYLARLHHHPVSLYAEGSLYRMVGDLVEEANLDGARLVAGLEVHFGGMSDSLRSIDRYGPVDATGFWLNDVPGYFQSVTVHEGELNPI